ncbi:MAG: hypothetical protein M3Y84_01055, partial [Acidobacteriota bacterium]|nr:hypothetical protein [Acidobacteriota bacterium]
SRFEPREGNINTSLSATLEMTPASYATRYRHSAMKRAKLSGLQRNARALLKYQAGQKPDAGAGFEDLLPPPGG